MSPAPRRVVRRAPRDDAALRVLRAGLALLEAYAYREEQPLQCPIPAIGGREDASVSPAERTPRRV
jgi:surfactin synthase thioesterase subunit